MRIKILFVMITILLVNSCTTGKNSFGQDIKLENIKNLNIENLIDSLKVEGELNQMVKSTQVIIDKLKESAIDNRNFFPYNSYDSVIYTNLKSNFIRTLRSEEAEHLTFILNNPIAFVWGECGTFNLEGRFEYISNNLVIAYANVGCEGNQIEIYPKNVLTRDGGLSEKGKNWFKLLTN